MTPFGFCVVPEVKAMIAGEAGIDRRRASDRIAIEQSRRTGWRPRAATAAGVSPTTSQSGSPRRDEQVGIHRQVIGVAEPVDGHDHIGLGRAEDVVDLLRAVEVHDRHDHGARGTRRPRT